MITEKDLLITIWTKPKLTFEFILANCPKKYVTILFILGGIAGSVSRTQVNVAEHKTFSIAILILAVFLGGIFGLIFFYIYAALLSWTGEWLDGKARTNQFLTVLAWSSIPSICILILMVPKFIIFGDKTFSININELNQLSLILYYFFEIAEGLLSLWAIVILISGICLIQGFNIWKAILNSILPIFIIMIGFLSIAAISSILHLLKK